MIGFQVKGTNFRALLNYLESKEGACLIGGNMAGKNPCTLAAEFRVAAELKPRVKRAVYHASLSLPHEEHLEDETWRAIADDYRKGMGFNDCQYAVYRHTDREHDHVHIVASRISIIDGSTVSDSWDYRRSENLIRELEQKYQLESVHPSDELDTRSPTTGEQRRKMRTGEVGVRVKLQGLIDNCTQDNPTMPQLIHQLKDQGVDVRVRFSSTGKIREGISYELDGVAFSGTKLGAAYTFNGLQKHRGVTYDHQRHQEETCIAAAREPVRGNQISDGSKQVEESGEYGIERLAAPSFEEIERAILNPNATTSKSASNADADSDSSEAMQSEATGEINFKMATAQKEWESNPVWQSRQNWERNMITAAFDELLSSGEGSDNLKKASLENGQYVAFLVNSKSLYIFSESLPITSYKSSRDSLADNCSLTPQQKEEFLLPGQKLEQEFLLPGQKLEASDRATTSTKLEDRFEPIVFLKEFFDKYLKRHSNKSTTQVSTQASKPEPIDPMAEFMDSCMANEQASTPTQVRKPSPKLLLPESVQDRRDYLDNIYNKLASSVRKEFPFNPIEDIDVGVAGTATLDGYSDYDIRLILLRSPKSQDLREEHGFDNMSDYIDQRQAIASEEMQLYKNPELRERFNIVKPIIDNYCKNLPFEDETNDKDYSLKKVGDTRTIVAHDGRGEVLKLTGKWVEKCCLIDKDVQVFQKVEADIAEFNRQKQEQIQPRTKKPKLKQKQLEL